MKMTFGGISRDGLVTVALGAALIVGCGGKQSIASKSASAYRDAIEKGIPVSKGGHGGHSVGEGASAEGMDHSKVEKSGMAGMDHSKVEKSGMAGMDHSKMEKSGMAGMDHSPPQVGGMAMGDPATAAIVSNQSAKATPGGPAAILSPDPLDAPSATAVEEAGRSEQMNEGMSSGDGMMSMSHGKFVQRDAGRQQATPGAPSHGMRTASESKDGSKGAAETYTCPMHSEVKSAVPGTCPKCGMTLIKKGKR